MDGVDHGSLCTLLHVIPQERQQRRPRNFQCRTTTCIINSNGTRQQQRLRNLHHCLRKSSSLCKSDYEYFKLRLTKFCDYQILSSLHVLFNYGWTYFLVCPTGIDLHQLTIRQSFCSIRWMVPTHHGYDLDTASRENDGYHFKQLSSSHFLACVARACETFLAQYKHRRRIAQQLQGESPFNLTCGFPATHPILIQI